MARVMAPPVFCIMKGALAASKTPAFLAFTPIIPWPSMSAHHARAAGHQQARIGIGAAGAADRLARLAHRFARYGAAVDHDEIVLACQHRADLFAFGQVEPATQRDDLRAAHAKSPHSKLPR